MSKQSYMPIVDANVTSNGWGKIFILGGIAALLAGILFRRNLAVEIGMFSSAGNPETVVDWFSFLQNNRFLALIKLHVFDIVNYVLLSLMFVALYAVLKEKSKCGMTISVIFAFMGISIYISTNTSFSMLALSDQYASAVDQMQKDQLLASGQAMLTLSRFSGSGAHPANGGLFSILFMAIATLLSSVSMIKSNMFRRIVAYIGITAGALDLIYCIMYVFIPSIDKHIIAVLFIPAAGLLLMIWHIMVGWKLYRLNRFNENKLSNMQA